MPYSEARFAMGRSDKSAPPRPSEPVEAAAYQMLSLVEDRVDGRDVWVRSFEIVLPTGETAAQGSIVLDRSTLAPISASVEQGGSKTTRRYDWDRYVVEETGPDGDGAAESMDLSVLEAAAHETWMAAIPWEEGLRVMLPTILAGGGGKWWAVPHVVGSEAIDLGDGVDRMAWVVELDWWGMGKDHQTFTPGGRTNGTAGPGGKYWVVQDPPPGTPPVVRVLTEANEEVDQVIQLDMSPRH